MPLTGLRDDHQLCISVGRMKGAGAYVVDRAAARAFFQNLRPMWLPFDHAFDREWCYGLRAACVIPFPSSQTEQRFRSSIQSGTRGKLAAGSRWLTTYPFQAYNEVGRWIFRFGSYARAHLAMLFVARPRVQPYFRGATGARLPSTLTGS